LRGRIRVDKAMSNEKNEKKKRQKEVFLKSLLNGTSIVKACQAADIGVATAWRWRKNSKAFDDKVLAVFESRTQVAEDALYKNVLKGNVVAQIFWLKNRAQDRWKDRQAIAFENPPKFQVEITNNEDKGD
jgi:hypothetical protein